MSHLNERKSAKRRAFPPTLLVGFACNDGDNGAWRGTVEAMRVSALHESIDLEQSHGSSPRLSVGDDWLRFLRNRVPILGTIEWHGNWCWNAYRMAIGDAATLLCAAMQSEKFTTDGARGNAACDLLELLKADAPHTMVADYLLKMAVADYLLKMAVAVYLKPEAEH